MAYNHTRQTKINTSSCTNQPRTRGVKCQIVHVDRLILSPTLIHVESNILKDLLHRRLRIGTFEGFAARSFYFARFGLLWLWTQHWHIPRTLVVEQVNWCRWKRGYMGKIRLTWGWWLTRSWHHSREYVFIRTSGLGLDWLTYMFYLICPYNLVFTSGTCLFDEKGGTENSSLVYKYKGIVTLGCRVLGRERLVWILLTNGWVHTRELVYIRLDLDLECEIACKLI